MDDILDTLDRIGRALALEFAGQWGARLGGDVTVAPSGTAAGAGHLVSLPVEGPIAGPITLWIDAPGAAATARQAMALDRAPATDEIQSTLAAILAKACDALRARPDGAALVFGTPAFRAGGPARDAHTLFLAVPNVASCQVAVGGTQPPLPLPAPPADPRLDAVLDVDLPLVVRFGRAVMLLRTIADLGPGSVIDMARSPDEPVDLLVGDRLIARGEVVIVGGHYGVRVTELMEGRAAAAHLEAR
jgi:flagellar motor switch protein FliN/FliY